MRVIACILVLVPLLAGCSTPPPQGAPPPDVPSSAPAAAPTNATRTLHQAFDVTAQPARGDLPTPTDPRPKEKENCVFIAIRDGGRVLGGRVVATWTSTGASPKLRLVAGPGNGGKPNVETGESGVSAPIPAMVPGNAPYVALDIPSDPTGVGEQPAKLDIEVNASGPVAFGGLGICHPPP